MQKIIISLHRCLFRVLNIATDAFNSPGMKDIKLGLREIHSINSKICFTILKVNCIFTIKRVHCISIAASKICQTKSTDPT